jgi:hypothetical protein
MIEQVERTLRLVHQRFGHAVEHRSRDKISTFGRAAKSIAY